MKSKKLFTSLRVRRLVVLVTVCALMALMIFSLCSFTVPRPTTTAITFNSLSLIDGENLLSIAVSQYESGFFLNYKPVLASHHNNTVRLYMVPDNTSYSLVISGSSFTLSHSKYVARYFFTAGGFGVDYTSDTATGDMSQVIFYRDSSGQFIINSSFAFSGSSGNNTISNAAASWRDVHSKITNYETDIQNAVTTGQNYGYQLGKTACEATHQQIFDDGYDEGYDLGYSSGYYIGLYDCDKTHDTIRKEARDEGYADGAMDGYANCGTTHDVMLEEACAEARAVGDAEGYSRGLLEAGKNNQLELDNEYWRGRSEGYDYGYTEALESSDVVLDYVDGIFSAPINFLYRAFNIEILGINLFNVLMLFLSIIIVGGVVLLVLKFR